MCRCVDGESLRRHDSMDIMMIKLQTTHGVEVINLYF